MSIDIQLRDPSYPTIKDLGGRILDLRRLVNPEDKLWSATNPSIGKDPKGRYVTAIRSSNYVIQPSGELVVTNGGLIRAKVWFAELNKEFKVENLRMIDTSKCPVKIDRGLEDPKLFWRDGHWQFTAVLLEPHTPRARMAVCHLDKKCTQVIDMEIFPGVDARRPEKNWAVPYEKNPNFDFIYGPNSTIKDGVVHTLMSDIHEVSAIRGNSNLLLLPDNTYLAVVHRMWGEMISGMNMRTFVSHKGYDREYVHYFAQYDYYGKMIALSKGFHFYRRGIEFAAGLTDTKTEFIVSYGSQDLSSHLAFMPKDIVLRSLIPIPY